MLIGGDFDAEVGAQLDKDNTDVLGAFGDKHRTATGNEIIEFCREEGLMVASIFYKQRCKHTWWYLRFGSGHQLDHFLVRNTQRWNVRSCLTLHYGRRKSGTRESEQTEARRGRRKGRTYQFTVDRREDGVIA